MFRGGVVVEGVAEPRGRPRIHEGGEGVYAGYVQDVVGHVAGEAGGLGRRRLHRAICEAGGQPRDIHEHFRARAYLGVEVERGCCGGDNC